jgi:hypothetical protein
MVRTQQIARKSTTRNRAVPIRKIFNEDQGERSSSVEPDVVFDFQRGEVPDSRLSVVKMMIDQEMSTSNSSPSQAFWASVRESFGEKKMVSREALQLHKLYFFSICLFNLSIFQSLFFSALTHPSRQKKL